jgi:hypothetical protein
MSAGDLGSAPLLHAHLASQGEPVPLPHVNDMQLGLFQMLLGHPHNPELRCMQISEVVEAYHKYDTQGINWEAVQALIPPGHLLSPLAEYHLYQQQPAMGKRSGLVRSIVQEMMPLDKAATFLSSFLKNATLEERVLFRPERFPFDGQDVGIDPLFLLPVSGQWFSGRRDVFATTEMIERFLIQNCIPREGAPQGRASKQEWPPVALSVSRFKAWANEFGLEQLMQISRSFQGKASLFCAGGSCVVFLTNNKREQEQTDLDLFVLGVDDQARYALLEQCLEWLESQYKASFTVYGAVVTATIPWLTNKLQLIVSNLCRPVEVLYNFDCSSVQFGITEDMQVVATPEALLFTPYLLNLLFRHTVRFPRFVKWTRRDFLPVSFQETLYIVHGSKFFELTAAAEPLAIGPNIVQAMQLKRLSPQTSMYCKGCKCNHGPVFEARINERPPPKEVVLDKVGALAKVDKGPIWANLMGDYHQHVFSSLHCLQEVFVEFQKKQWTGPIYLHIWNCTLEGGMIAGWMHPAMGTSSLPYLHDLCDLGVADLGNVPSTSDPCAAFHPAKVKECPRGVMRLEIAWNKQRTIGATPLTVLNHGGSCISVERIPASGARFHMLLAVTSDQWEISMIHVISPVFALSLTRA